jgi:ABC-type antimicrobial peptide transport system permease subunit
VANKSVVTIKESLSIAWKRIAGLSRFGKLFYLGFVGVAMLVAIAIGLLSNVYYFNPDNFLTAHDDTVIIEYDEQTYSQMMDLEDIESVGYVSLITNDTQLTFDMPKLYQSWQTQSSYPGYGVRSEYLSDGDIIVGRNAVAYDEIVLDKMLVDRMLKSSSFKSIGITTYSALMNIDIILTFDNGQGEFEYYIDIVGISDTVSPVFYATEETIYMLQTGIAVYEVFEDSITLDSGVLPSGTKEAIIFDDIVDPVPYVSLLRLPFEVTGLFTSSVETPKILVPLELVKEIYFDINYNTPTDDIYLHSTNIGSTISYFNSNDIYAYGLFAEQESNYKVDRLMDSLGITIFTLVVLAASSLSFYFIIRSSLISRIYEVSVYRALGVSKNDIRKMFITEIILITSITSLVGYLLTTYLLLKLQAIAEDFVEIFHISFLSLTGGIVLIYVINIVSGLLPVSTLLRRTPAEILSKYDF